MAQGKSLRRHSERLGPYLGGLAALVCGLLWTRQIFDAFTATGMDQKDSVAAVFNVMVTLTAFLFSVFILAIAPGGGFLEKIFGSKTFGVFKRYVVEALILGGVTAMASVPFMTTPAGVGIWQYALAQIVWGALVVTATLAFLRVMHIFIVWVGYDRVHRRANSV